MVKKLPFNAGDMTSIPGWGTRIPHAWRQLKLCATIRESPRAATKSKRSQKNKKKKKNNSQNKVEIGLYITCKEDCEIIGNGRFWNKWEKLAS